MKDFFSNVYQKLHSTLLGPVLVGILVFGLFFDFSILEPANTAWILRDGGDALQHYLGGFAFRSDNWHFPLTKTVLMYEPEGVSIVFTDSNPLLSILTKCFRFIIPPHYQFFGIWFLACWILQALLSYLLVRKLTGNKHYALLAAVLFCLLPTQYARLGHTNLVAFWIILWGMYVFVHPDFTDKRKGLFFFIILALASLIHAYMMFMVFFLALTWYTVKVIQLYREKAYPYLFRFIAVQALYGIALLVLMWITGYFYNIGPVKDLNGFGFYSMNLNAPFNAMYTRFSKFMTPLPSYGGQYEGYQYLGFGFIILLFFVAFLFIRKYKPYQLPEGFLLGILCLAFLFIRLQDIPFQEKLMVSLFFLAYGGVWYSAYREEQQPLTLLFIPATACFFYALSYKVMLGNTLLFESEPSNDSFYFFFLQSARSSGRFFWPTALCLLLTSVFLLHRYLGRGRKSLLFLSVFIAFQYADISIHDFIIASNERDFESPLDDASKTQVLASRSVKFLSGFDMQTASFALLNGKSVNKFYIAHESNAATQQRLFKEKQDFRQGNRNTKDLYLFETVNDLPLDTIYKVHAFYGNKLSVSPKGYTAEGIEVMHKQNDSLRALIRWIKNSPLVLISVKDESSKFNPDFFKQHLDSLYNTRFSNIGFRQSYLAVFSYGKLIEEQLGAEHSVEYNASLLDYAIFVKSAGYDHGNESLIKINEANLSLNQKGFNVCVLQVDASGKTTWISYCFDTFTKEYTQ